ncbi:hypothetical protein BO83DRAFT_10363 [Aspergillus eucalypticola CBS 122712]|uniref:Uncharacterized protein n=1 Tax=Aspergillus eucalypticola (strain CBS 122712 / IBT 29274) TaxID=1448314 RepID=A0A317WGJ1_ASPEC|nr:uncharacterized protein BO83DRAFT_10363 [Aspergillus eucalypticola CBS 122712]PWY85584.1 hypothetical protein BO83DRAFT_10363 [Aspergillus eucalypticola CBS 122712]
MSSESGASYYPSSMTRTSRHLSTPKRHSGWSAIPCKPRLCCISDHLLFLRPGRKGPPGKPYPPFFFPLIVGSRFYLVRSSFRTYLTGTASQPAGKPTRGLNTDTPDRTKLSLAARTNMQ